MDELPIVARLEALSNPPYDAGVFGGPMSRAAALIRAQHEALRKLYDEVKHMRANRDLQRDFCEARDAARAALAKAREA